MYKDGLHYTDITKPLYQESKGYDPVDTMQYIDIHTWMRGDILLKADRVTMAHSLELRVPFLDKEVFRSCISNTNFLKNGQWNNEIYPSQSS